ncbi:MAG TPA: Rpn family recombination-promoting nuclease/putative transposase [Planctomycetota bacterium]
MAAISAFAARDREDATVRSGFAVWSARAATPCFRESTRTHAPGRPQRGMKHPYPPSDPDCRNPEGVLFRTVFGEPKQAEGLLRGFLPPDILATIDWSSLQRVDRTFVDEALGHLHADVLFSARIGDRQGFLYLFLERASDGRPTEFHVMRNVASLLEHWATENTDAVELPPVVPYAMRLGQEP